MTQQSIVVGVSGASGMPVAVKVLEVLHKTPSIYTHLVVTDSAKLTFASETGQDIETLYSLADEVMDNRNIGASVCSGSYRTAGMLIVPCSMKTAAGINSGYSDNLLLRAADVTLKERRKLVLAVRESPFSTIHLRNLMELSQYGAVIVPLMVNYYSRPETIDDLTTQLAGKILDQFGIEMPNYYSWKGL